MGKYYDTGMLEGTSSDFTRKIAVERNSETDNIAIVREYGIHSADGDDYAVYSENANTIELFENNERKFLFQDATNETKPHDGIAKHFYTELMEKPGHMVDGKTIKQASYLLRQEPETEEGNTETTKELRFEVPVLGNKEDYYATLFYKDDKAYFLSIQIHDKNGFGDIKVEIKQEKIDDNKTKISYLFREDTNIDYLRNFKKDFSNVNEFCKFFKRSYDELEAEKEKISDFFDYRTDGIHYKCLNENDAKFKANEINKMVDKFNDSLDEKEKIEKIDYNDIYESETPFENLEK